MSIGISCLYKISLIVLLLGVTLVYGLNVEDIGALREVRSLNSEFGLQGTSGNGEQRKKRCEDECADTNTKSEGPSTPADGSGSKPFENGARQPNQSPSYSSSSASASSSSSSSNSNRPSSDRRAGSGIKCSCDCDGLPIFK